MLRQCAYNYKSIKNFVTYVKKFNNSRLKRNDTITIISDSSNYLLSKMIVNELRKTFHNTVMFYAKEIKSTQLLLLELKKCTLALFFYNNLEDTSRPFLEKKYLERLSHYVETDLGKGLNRKCYVLQGIENVFNKLYSHKSDFYSNLNNRLINTFQKEGKVKFYANDSFLEFSTQALSAWTSALGLENSFYPAEIANFSPDISGEIKFTGIIISVLPFTQKYGVIKDPITFKIEKARLTDVDCENSNLKKDLMYYFNRSEMNRKVCEVGIGTNHGMTALLPVNCLAQERFHGFHLGFGGESTKSSYDSIHLDIIFDNAQIFLNNDIIFDGKVFNC